MKHRRAFGGAVLLSGTLFLIALYLNRLAFPVTTLAAIDDRWIYFPAGLRLLITLMLGEAGAVGILLASWIMAFTGPEAAMPLRAFFCGPIAAGAAYLVYRFGVHFLHTGPALSRLTPAKLLVLILVNAVVSPVLIGVLHVSLYLSVGGLAFCLMVRFIADLAGTFSVIYLLKWVLRYVPLPASDDFGMRGR